MAHHTSMESEARFGVSLLTPGARGRCQPGPPGMAWWGQGQPPSPIAVPCNVTGRAGSSFLLGFRSRPGVFARLGTSLGALRAWGQRGGG